MKYRRYPPAPLASPTLAASVTIAGDGSFDLDPASAGASGAARHRARSAILTPIDPID